MEHAECAKARATAHSPTCIVISSNGKQCRSRTYLTQTSPPAGCADGPLVERNTAACWLLERACGHKAVLFPQPFWFCGSRVAPFVLASLSPCRTPLFLPQWGSVEFQVRVQVHVHVARLQKSGTARQEDYHSHLQDASPARQVQGRTGGRGAGAARGRDHGLSFAVAFRMTQQQQQRVVL